MTSHGSCNTYKAQLLGFCNMNDLKDLLVIGIDCVHLCTPNVFFPLNQQFSGDFV